ncbi:MAG: hypothetical protein ACRDKL_07210 [Solirubrobacteraceae bacterium]
MANLAAAIAALLAWVLGRFRRRRRLPGRTLILSPRESTVIASDGAVRSTQVARLTLPLAELQRLWTPPNLENLGRSYWLFLTRATLGLIRVRYGERDRSVVLLTRALTLLRFDAPEYELDPERAQISWRIRGGLLVARGAGNSGGLSLSVSRVRADTDPAVLLIEVEVANYHPAIVSGLGTAAYEATQAFVHVLVTHAFLRSLATLQLPESRVGRLRSGSGQRAGTEPEGE